VTHYPTIAASSSISIGVGRLINPRHLTALHLAYRHLQVRRASVL